MMLGVAALLLLLLITVLVLVVWNNRESQRLIQIQKEIVAHLRLELRQWRTGELALSPALPTTPTPSDSAVPDATIATGKLEQELKRLHQKLAEKDNEINRQRQHGQRLKEQHLEQDKLISTSRKDYEQLQHQMSQILTETEATMEQNLKHYQKQLKVFRTEIAAKEAQIDEFRELTQDLQTLLNSREMLVSKLQNRIQSAACKRQSVENAGCLAQKQRIAHLENNLNDLTKIHEKLVREDTGRHGELRKLDTQLRATLERIRTLEAALREAQAGSIRDHNRYQNEIDRIKCRRRDRKTDL